MYGKEVLDRYKASTVLMIMHISEHRVFMGARSAYASARSYAYICVCACGCGFGLYMLRVCGFFAFSV